MLWLVSPAAWALAPGVSPGDGGTAETVALAEKAAAAARRGDGAPDLMISKTSNADAPLDRGDEVRYTVTVTNVGEATAHGVAVFDDLPTGTIPINLLPVMDGGTCTAVGGDAGGEHFYAVHCTRETLEPGESAVLTIDVEILPDAPCGDLLNVADVEARDEPKENVGSDNVAEHADEVRCSASISLDKTGPAAVHAGDRVPYRFTVVNDGDVRLYDVSVSDPSCDEPPRADGGAPTALSPGRRWIFTCTHTVTGTDPDPLTGRATAIAYDDDGHPVRAADGHVADVLHPGVRIVQTVKPASGTPGTRVVYRFEVTNTGDSRLSEIEVTDEVTGHVGTIAAMQPGQTRVLKAPASLQTDDPKVSNLATVRASDPLGLEVTDSDDAFVTIVASAPGGGDGPGGTPFTGGRIARPGVAAAALALLGVAVLMVTRSRRSERQPSR
jgi:uncharacterized repeat protein (TIGR01451 family)